MGRSTPLPSTTSAPDYLVGRDAEGHWIVRDARGLVGGLFADRDAAIRFADFETDHRPDAVVFVPERITLSLVGDVPQVARFKNVWALRAA